MDRFVDMIGSGTRFLPLHNPTQFRQVLERSKGDIGFNPQQRYQSILSAILGQQRQPLVDGIHWGGGLHRLAVHLDLTRAFDVSEQCPSHLVIASADQAKDTQHFTRGDREAQIPHTLSIQLAHFQDGPSDLSRGLGEIVL